MYYKIICIVLICLVIGFIASKSNELFIVSSNKILYENTKYEKNSDLDMKYIVPMPANQLDSNQLQKIDTNILRNIRVEKTFSNIDELTFSQMYNILKQLRDQTIYINNVQNMQNLDSDLFTRIKMELISSINSLIIQNDYYLPYHKYQFFKIINSNTIETSRINSKTKYIFTLTIAREYKYQQFIIYFDLELNLDNHNIIFNKIELIGLPIPNTNKFHQTREKDNESNKPISLLEKINKLKNADTSYKNEVMANSDTSKYMLNPSMKFIDVMERSDMDQTLFNSQEKQIEEHILDHAKDQQFKNHRCYGLINNINKELTEYNNNQIFCESYHPEINQVGIWDAPCQINSDCPFYKANKNYPNEFGKCDKTTGKCEMPMGITAIGFTKYGKTEPYCYNCKGMSNKCCGQQMNDINKGIVKYKSPDYIFFDDEYTRRQHSQHLDDLNLLIRPSI